MGEMWPQAKDCLQPQKLVEARKEFFPRAFRGSTVLLYLDFRFLASRTMRKYFCRFKPPTGSNCYSHLRILICPKIALVLAKLIT